MFPSYAHQEMGSGSACGYQAPEIQINQRQSDAAAKLLDVPITISTRFNVDSDNLKKKKATGSPNQILRACSADSCLGELDDSAGPAAGVREDFADILAKNVGPAKTTPKMLWAKFRTFLKLGFRRHFLPSTANPGAMTRNEMKTGRSRQFNISN